jgi:quercetin dioxygenase-like cupin family protein
MERVSTDDVDAVEAVSGVHLSQLAAGDRTSVQGFTIGAGEEVPAHSHDHEQAGFVYEGELTFLVGEDREEVAVGAGDSYVLPGGEVHAAENRGAEPVRGVDIFSPPRTDPDWAE